METVLMNQTQDKSKRGLMIFRQLHKCGEGEGGLIAWLKANAWYMQTSGLGMSNKRAKLMMPERSKKDEDVIRDFQKWVDDERELTRLKNGYPRDTVSQP